MPRPVHIIISLELSSLIYLGLGLSSYTCSGRLLQLC